jgi:hypothetical protein
MLGALVKSLCLYQGRHLEEVSEKVTLNNKIFVTGGGLNAGIIKAKKKWMKDCEYIYKEQSSLEGAARLAEVYLQKN